MEKSFTGLKLEYWYHVFVALGAAGVIASLSVDLKGIANTHALMLSLGMFFIGIGEWINHPLQVRLMSPNLYMPGGGKLTSHPRSNQFLGVLFDLAGLGLAGAAMYKILQAA